MMRHIIRLVLPVAALALVAGMLPVIPADVGRTSQLAQVQSSFGGGSGVTGNDTSGGRSVFEQRQDAFGSSGAGAADYGSGASTLGGTTSANPTYFQIIPIASPAASGSLSPTNPGATASPTIGFGSGTGSLPGAEVVATPSLGATGVGLANQLWEQAQGSAAASPVTDSSSQVINFAQTQQGARLVNSIGGDSTAPLGTVAEACINQKLKAMDVEIAQHTGDSSYDEASRRKRCSDAIVRECQPAVSRADADSSCGVPSNGGAATAGASAQPVLRSTSVYIDPARTNVVGLIPLSENNVGLTGGGVAPSAPVASSFFIPSTATVSTRKCAGCIEVQITNAQISGSEIVGISNVSNGAVDVQVQTAGSLVDEIRLAVVNQQAVTVSGGQTVILPKVNALTVLSSGIGDVFGSIGRFFGALGGGSGSGGAGGGSGGGGIGGISGGSGESDSGVPTDDPLDDGKSCGRTCRPGVCETDDHQAGICRSGTSIEVKRVACDSLGVDSTGHCIGGAAPEGTGTPGLIDVPISTCTCEPTTPDGTDPLPVPTPAKICPALGSQVTLPGKTQTVVVSSEKTFNKGSSSGCVEAGGTESIQCGEAEVASGCKWVTTQHSYGETKECVYSYSDVNSCKTVCKDGNGNDLTTSGQSSGDIANQAYAWADQERADQIMACQEGLDVDASGVCTGNECPADAKQPCKCGAEIKLAYDYEDTLKFTVTYQTGDSNTASAAASGNKKARATQIIAKVSGTVTCSVSGSGTKMCGNGGVNVEPKSPPGTGPVGGGGGNGGGGSGGGGGGAGGNPNEILIPITGITAVTPKGILAIPQIIGDFVRDHIFGAIFNADSDQGGDSLNIGISCTYRSKVVVYGATWCSYCHQLDSALRGGANATTHSYIEIDKTNPPTALPAGCGGTGGVPCTEISYTPSNPSCPAKSTQYINGRDPEGVRAAANQDGASPGGVTPPPPPPTGGTTTSGASGSSGDSNPPPERPEPETPTVSTSSGGCGAPTPVAGVAAGSINGKIILWEKKLQDSSPSYTSSETTNRLEREIFAAATCPGKCSATGGGCALTLRSGDASLDKQGTGGINSNLTCGCGSSNKVVSGAGSWDPGTGIVPRKPGTDEPTPTPTPNVSQSPPTTPGVAAGKKLCITLGGNANDTNLTNPAGKSVKLTPGSTCVGATCADGSDCKAYKASDGAIGCGCLPSQQKVATPTPPPTPPVPPTQPVANPSVGPAPVPPPPPSSTPVTPAPETNPDKPKAIAACAPAVSTTNSIAHTVLPSSVYNFFVTLFAAQNIDQPAKACKEGGTCSNGKTCIIADNCSCGAAPVNSAPAVPVAPAPEVCDASTAPTCGGTCAGGGTCGAKTYKICPPDDSIGAHDDFDVNSGYSRAEWRDLKAIQTTCNKVKGKDGSKNCTCAIPKPVKPSTPPSTPTAGGTTTPPPQPVKPPTPPVTSSPAVCKYTYKYRVDIWTAVNCPPCGLYKPAGENTGSETVGSWLNNNTNAGTRGDVTVNHIHIPDYNTNNTSPLGSTPTFQVTMTKTADPSNDASCPAGGKFTGQARNPRAFNDIANAIVELFKAHQ